MFTTDLYICKGRQIRKLISVIVLIIVQLGVKNVQVNIKLPEVFSATF